MHDAYVSLDPSWLLSANREGSKGLTEKKGSWLWLCCTDLEREQASHWASLPLLDCSEVGGHQPEYGGPHPVLTVQDPQLWSVLLLDKKPAWHTLIPSWWTAPREGLPQFHGITQLRPGWAPQFSNEGVYGPEPFETSSIWAVSIHPSRDFVWFNLTHQKFFFKHQNIIDLTRDLIPLSGLHFS